MAMGPEAALLSARLAEIRKRGDLARPIYVEAAGKARHTGLWIPTQRPEFWPRRRAPGAVSPFGARAALRGDVTAAAIPALALGGEARRKGRRGAPLAVLPACCEAPH